MQTNRPGSSSQAEGNILQEHDESEAGDAKESSTEDLWPMRGEIIYRHFEEPRLKLQDPDNEILDPIEVRRCDEADSYEY